jgi:hypothetical protein
LVERRRPAVRSKIVVFQPGSSSTLPASFRAVLNLTYDESSSRLDYSLSIDRPGRDQLSAVWIHAGTLEKPGAARHQILAPGQPTSGSIMLSAADRRDLMNGSLIVRFFVPNGRGSAGDVPISFR